jgi:hypothetical protein
MFVVIACQVVLTSRATSTLPLAKPDSIYVMCAYPVGVTLHCPSVSPSAASNPAETVRKGYGKSRETPLNGIDRGLTDDQLRSKLIGDWHDDFLERVEVIRVAEPSLWPGNVHAPVAVDQMPDQSSPAKENISLSLTFPLPSRTP